MGDGLTDIERDRERGERFEAYLAAVADWLEAPTEEGRRAVLARAEAVDAVPAGYWGGRTSLAAGAAKELDGLRAGDRRSWARLLAAAHGTPHYRRLKGLSPFRGLAMVILDYGLGFATVRGEAEALLSEAVRSRGWKTYDCDTYALFLDEDAFRRAGVEWVRCGIAGVDGPREVAGGCACT